MISEGIITSNDYMCILQKYVLVCGVKEGWIQLWDMRVSRRVHDGTVGSQFVDNSKEYYLSDDNIEEEGQYSTLTAIEKLSDTEFATLDNRGRMELW